MRKLHGWIIYNGTLPSNDFIDLAEWLHEAAKKINLSTEIVSNNNLLTYITSDQLELIGENKQNLPNFVIFTDKDIYLAKQLELLGVRVFNSSEAIENSDDKITSYQLLAKEKLPIPKTIIAPKIFPGSYHLDLTFIDSVLEKLSFPLVIKEAFGSFGEQVYLVENREQLIAKTKQIAGKPFIYQEFISSSYGRDLRLHVVGNEVVASMIRTSIDDFRANITIGGSMKAYNPTETEKDLAIKATKAVQADFAGVDLLFGPNHSPIICEVNSNAHIRNMYDCTNINVADYIVSYILKYYKKRGLVN